MYDDLKSSSSPCPEFVGRFASFSGPALHDDRPDPKDNRLLASLTEAGCREILSALEGVSLPRGLALYESGGPQRYVYFPTSSIVSILCVLENGASTEVAVTGNEGMVGISLFMGSETTSNRAVVLSAGYAYRLSGAVLKKQFEHC